ncbi:MAG: carboxyltransferase domain-containing protein [Gemmataceae bacterium]
MSGHEQSSSEANERSKRASRSVGVYFVVAPAALGRSPCRRWNTSPTRRCWRCARRGRGGALAAAARRLAAPWQVDIVAAYTTVAVFVDLETVRLADARAVLERIDPAEQGNAAARLHRIPCCYALESDLDRVARYTSLSVDEVIRLHAATEYIVYAIGFCPGFPYLGYLPDAAMCGAAAGGAADAGRTGQRRPDRAADRHLPEARPGGWNLVGRTPLVLVDVADDYFPLRTGDRVRFDPIDEATFHHLAGRRLAGG